MGSRGNEAGERVEPTAARVRNPSRWFLTRARGRGGLARPAASDGVVAAVSRVSRKEYEAQATAENIHSRLQYRRPPVDTSEPYWVIDEQYERAIGLNRLGAIRDRKRQRQKLATKE
jgi:hypothetical protein